MGNPAKPNNLRGLEGMRGHRPLAGNGVNYVSEIPDKPRGMSASAKTVWKDLMEELTSMNVLRRIDAMALAQLCEDQAMLNEMRRGQAEMAKALVRIATEQKTVLHGGPMVELSRTTEGRRTAITIKELSFMVMMQRREFGMTPVSSNRLMNGSPESDKYIDPIEGAMLSFVPGGKAAG